MTKESIIKYLFITLFILSLTLDARALDYADDEDVTYFEQPLREVSLIVNDEGYFPKNISIFEGEKVRFFLTTITEKPTCMVMPGSDLYLGVTKGKIAEGEAYFPKSGSYKFYCPSGKIFGQITVMPRKIRKKIDRNVASKVKIWMPRDE